MVDIKEKDVREVLHDLHQVKEYTFIYELKNFT